MKICPFVAESGHSQLSSVFSKLSLATSRSEIETVLNSLGTLRQEEFASLPRENNQSRIIMSQGVDGDGVVTKSEFMIVQLASDEKLTKRTANRIIKMVKRKDFNPAEIRSSKIQSLESAIAKADGGSIFEYDVWKQGDGQQDLKLYLRNLRTILEDLLADQGYVGYQYLSFKLLERNGSRVFGPANSTVWWQINAELIGADRVLIGIVIFTDGSWNKCALSCESIYGNFVLTRIDS